MGPFSHGMICISLIKRDGCSGTDSICVADLLTNSFRLWRSDLSPFGYVILKIDPTTRPQNKAGFLRLGLKLAPRGELGPPRS
jgi:hypothetical protein